MGSDVFLKVRVLLHMTGNINVISVRIYVLCSGCEFSGSWVALALQVIDSAFDNCSP